MRYPYRTSLHIQFLHYYHLLAYRLQTHPHYLENLDHHPPNVMKNTQNFHRTLEFSNGVYQSPLHHEVDVYLDYFSIE